MTARVYLDAAATTPLSPRVLDAMRPHLAGEDRAAWLAAHAEVAEWFGVPPERLELVPGGTAANNLALRTAAREGARVISQPTEHPSVLEPLRALEREGARVEWLPVSRDGRVDPEDLRSALREPAALVSVMYANHETGVLQDHEALGAVCREAGVLFHVDGVQGLRTGDLTSVQADLLCVSGHKVRGPKGIGALIRSAQAPVLSSPVRVSTALVVGFAAALRARAVDASALAASRDALQARIEERLDGVRMVGAGAPRLPGHLCLSVSGVSGEAVVVALDAVGISISSGAACASGSGRPSPVLRALGWSSADARGSLRLSLLGPMDAVTVRRVADELTAAVLRLRQLAA